MASFGGKSIQGMKSALERKSLAENAPKEAAAAAVAREDAEEATATVSVEDGEPRRSKRPRRAAKRDASPGALSAGSMGSFGGPPPEVDVEGASAVEVCTRILAAMRSSSRGTYDAAALASTLCQQAAEKHAAFAELIGTYKGDDAYGDDLRNRARLAASPPKLSELMEEITGTLVVHEAKGDPYFSELRLAYREDGVVPAFHKLERLNYLAFDGDAISLSANGAPAVECKAPSDEGFTVIDLLDAIASTIAKHVAPKKDKVDVTFLEMCENAHADGVWDLKYHVDEPAC